MKKVEQHVSMGGVVCRRSRHAIEIALRKQDNVKCEKRVHFYLMEPIGGDFSLHDPEFDEVDWHSENDVLKIMTYSDEVGIVEKALKIAPNLM